MTCYSPVRGYRSRAGRNENGAWPIVFNKNSGFIDMPVEVPCGRCIGCRLERSRQWALRCMHEAKMYENNCYITLTYSDEYLPLGGSLNKDDFTKFMKRLRKHHGPKIRFFMCGEYGENYKRPHYHALLFNFDFADRVYFKMQNGFRLDTSEQLKKLWKFGNHMIGDVSFESAAYVARYITKKIMADEETVLKHYDGLVPEFCNMSRRPGIGKGFYERYSKDIYNHDKCVIRGSYSTKPPRYYDTLKEKDSPVAMEKIKERRFEKNERRKENNTPWRLRSREKVKEAQLSFKKRQLEKEGV